MTANQEKQLEAYQLQQKRRRTNASLGDGLDVFVLYQVEAPVGAPQSDSSIAVHDEIERYKRMKSEPFKADPIEFSKKQQYALCFPRCQSSRP